MRRNMLSCLVVDVSLAWDLSLAFRKRMERERTDYNFKPFIFENEKRLVHSFEPLPQESPKPKDVNVDKITPLANPISQKQSYLPLSRLEILSPQEINDQIPGSKIS